MWKYAIAAYCHNLFKHHLIHWTSSTLQSVPSVKGRCLPLLGTFIRGQGVPAGLVRITGTENDTCTMGCCVYVKPFP